MKILIYGNNEAECLWCKDILETFGRGMHIGIETPKTATGKEKNFSCVITIGDAPAPPHKAKYNFRCQAPNDDESKATCKRELWAMFRDTLRDAIGGKCSCGLYDICHCH